MISCGQVASRSYSHATGRISFSAKLWASSRRSFCSSVRVRSTTAQVSLSGTRTVAGGIVLAGQERQVGRGEAGVDVEAEVSRLLALDPDSEPDESGRQDAALREEVRQLVIARNGRRLARGEAPLDVEAEVERQLEELNGS